MDSYTTDDACGRNRFIVASEMMQTFMRMVERVARHVGTVLIVGETGTGKERIAHAIHDHSLRCSKPFVEINCAALPENLVESELFGYEKGAFSGADSAKPGLFEVAHTGTILLDEIGELDLKIQVKLLRVLDRAPYYRLGGHRKITSDVRVVAATNRNLKEEVAAGRFRKDLYHRLSQFELSVPPLRERLEDISALAEHFLAIQQNGLTFSSGALRMLENYSWPGNVRELQNVVNKVAVLASGTEVTAAEVSREIVELDQQTGTEESDLELCSMEEQAIRRALESTGGHRGQAATRLGISRRTLTRKLQEYGFPSSRGQATPAMGSLDQEQQQYFRAQLKVPVSLITSEGQEFVCMSANLSARGLGLNDLSVSLVHGALLRFQFELPDSMTIKGTAKLAWVSSEGRGGIAFAKLEPKMMQEIRSWLSLQKEREGWDVQSEPTQTQGASVGR